MTFWEQLTAPFSTREPSALDLIRREIVQRRQEGCDVEAIEERV